MRIYSYSLIVLALVFSAALGLPAPTAVAPTPVTLSTVEATSPDIPVPSPLPEPEAMAATEAVPAEPITRAEQVRPLPAARPSEHRLDESTLAEIDTLFTRKIEEGYFPGGVVLVARDGAVVKKSAYGNRVVLNDDGSPRSDPLPMLDDTLFDLASLTKLYTTTAVLTLVDAGKVQLDAAVATYIPEFGSNGKEDITIRHLLTHTAGLPAGLNLKDRGDTPEERINNAYRMKPTGKPGEKRVYSDAGPVFLGKVVERVTGMPLDQYLRVAVLEPLGLKNTMYNPPTQIRDRTAATGLEVLSKTEKASGKSPRRIWGWVHDSEAQALDGVAGNAGLFATAADVAVFGQMMLNGGSYDGVQILKRETAELAHWPQGQGKTKYGLGWELDQEWYMGDLSGLRTYGHTGFTGTSLVVSPDANMVVVVLSNRLHEAKVKSANSVRSGVADVAYAALLDRE